METGGLVKRIVSVRTKIEPQQKTQREQEDTKGKGDPSIKKFKTDPQLKKKTKRLGNSKTFSCHKARSTENKREVVQRGSYSTPSRNSGGS